MAASVSKSQCPLEESRILRCLVNGSVEMEVWKAVNQMDHAGLHQEAFMEVFRITLAESKT